jgi:GxxExxY protein
MLHEEITKDIIGAAMAVLNELKPGLDEKLYENALVIELRSRGHIVEQQREYPVHYRGNSLANSCPISSWMVKSSPIRKWFPRSMTRTPPSCSAI